MKATTRGLLLALILLGAAGCQAGSVFSGIFGDEGDPIDDTGVEADDTGTSDTGDDTGSTDDTGAADEECDNGIDDDGDGLIDCDDPDCDEAPECE